MEIVEPWIELGTRRHRRATENRDLAEGVRPLAYILHPAALDVHSADEDRVGPGEVIGTRGVHVFVDKADFPGLGKHRRDHQQTLRWHERAYSIGQRIGVFKGAERRNVARKHAENVPRASLLRTDVAAVPILDVLRHASHPEAPSANGWLDRELIGGSVLAQGTGSGEDVKQSSRGGPRPGNGPRA